MKIASTINNPWTVLCVCLSMVWWLAQNKAKIPDEIEPVTKAEVTPLEAAINYSAMVGAEQSIKYHNQNICDKIPTDREALADAELIYQTQKGRPHHYATMGRDAICGDVEARRALRQVARQR